jgi:hypothetical protein
VRIIQCLREVVQGAGFFPAQPVLSRDRIDHTDGTLIVAGKHAGKKKERRQKKRQKMNNEKQRKRSDKRRDEGRNAKQERAYWRLAR